MRAPHQLSSNMADPHGAQGSPLRLRALSKTFHSQGGGVKHALSELSLDVGAGEFVSILGPSGCGKSTLLMIAAGLEQPTSGAVLLGDTELAGPDPGLGIAFQRDCLLEWRNVIDNVLLQVELRGWPKAKYRERASELLDLVGLRREEHQRYPRELSGGMRQRVALCRALVHEPSVLLLDEPFGALDALTRERLNLDVSNLCSNWKTTVLFVTHDIAEAVYMGDRVAVMAANPGRLVEVMEVPLPRPRGLAMKASGGFNETVGRARQVLVDIGAYDR